MPTYAYKCDSCDHGFEMFQSITAKPVKKCPECHENKVRRLIGTGAGIIFKGSGFYETDYRSDSYKKAAEKETKAPDKKGTEKKDASGSDSKGTSSSSKKKPKVDTKE